MNPPRPDRDTLVGVLAHRTGLATREALDAACRARALDGSVPLDLILVDRGTITESTRSALEALAGALVRAHGGDAGQSLASFAAETHEIWPPGGGDDRTTPDGGWFSDAETAEAPPNPEAGRDAPGPNPPPRTGLAGVRYRLLRHHTRGGLGDVFVAFDEELKREVALKQIREKNAHDPRIRSRFVSEAEITGHLEHPGVVPVYGLGYYDDGRPFYAMKFIRGVSLAAAIERFHESRTGAGGDGFARSLEFRKLLRRFLDACDAVAYAHSRGVLHRDLKPDNVMLGKYGETLVVDWGLAKQIDAPEGSDYGAEGVVPQSSESGSHVTVDGSTLGTPAYMSPEQAAGEIDRLGPASDVYSLGATLYHLMVNRPPFATAEGDQEGDLLGRVRRSEFPHPRAVVPDIPRALEAVCLKALAPDPGGRYPSPRALADDVERWLADAPVTAWREPASVRAARWVARNRSMMATAGAALLVASIGAGFLALAEGRSNRRLAESNRKLQAVNRLALDAIRGYYTGVSGDLMLNQPQFEGLRNTLLRTPLEFYRRLKDLLPEGPDADPQAQAALGEAYFKVAAITDRIGVKDEALPAYQQARAIYERLAQDHPESPSYRAALAECLDGLASVEVATGSAAAALRDLRAALALWQGLARACPADLKTRAAEVACLKRIGQVEADTGGFEEALKSYTLARTILDELIRANPEEYGLRSELVGCLNRTAFVQETFRTMGEALETNREALEQLRRLPPAASGDPRFRHDEATCYRYIGWLECRAGRIEDGLRSLEQANSILEGLVRDHPAITEYRMDLAASRLRISWPLHRLKRLDEARREVEGALEITREVVRLNPNVVTYRAHLAWCHGEFASIDEAAGRFEEALRSYRHATDLCEELAQEHPEVEDYKKDCVQGLLNIGRVLGDLGRWAEARTSLESARRRTEALVADRGDVSDIRALASETLAELAKALVQLRCPGEEVLGIARGAVEHQRVVYEKAPQSVWYRDTLSRRYQYLAMVYRDREPAQPEGAVAATLARRDLWADSPPELFHAALDLAKCIPLAGPEGARRRGYTDLAVATLRMAIDAGFRDVYRLLTAPELTPLRDRPDFQRLVTDVLDLGFPDDPFGAMTLFLPGPAGRLSRRGG